MKKLLGLILLLGAIFLLAACSGEGGTMPTSQTLAETKPFTNLPKSGEIIELTVPAAILNMAEFYNLQIGDIYGLMEPVKIEDDGAHLYQMDKAIYDQYEKILKETVVSTLDNISSNHAYIRSVEYSDNFNTILVAVDSAAYANAGIRDIYQSFYITVIYQAFVSPISDNKSLHIQIADVLGGDVLDIIYLPQITSEYLSAF